MILKLTSLLWIIIVFIHSFHPDVTLKNLLYSNTKKVQKISVQLDCHVNLRDLKNVEKMTDNSVCGNIRLS